MRNNTKKGFTLVELLVVIAILAILATVSVVGYTSYIESTNLTVDKDLATQLNHFLEAYKVNHRDDITEDNVWHVTNEILELGGIDELQTKTNGYHFYYDFENDQYVVLSDKEALGNNSPLTGALRAFGLMPQADGTYLTRPGNCFTDGGKYFFVDTEGELAELINEFYTFNNDIDFATFYNKVTSYTTSKGEKLDALTTFVQKSVFITNAANLVVDVSDTHEYVFVAGDFGTTADGSTVSMSNKKTDLEGNPQYINNDNPLITTSKDIAITLPGNIVIYGGSLAVKVKDNADVVINLVAKSWDEIKNNIDAAFTNIDTVVTLNGTDYKIDDDKVKTFSGDAIVAYLKYRNPMTALDLIIKNDSDDLTHNVTDGDEDKTNLGYVAWHKGEFTILLSENDIKGKTDEPISNTEVNWTITSGDNYVEVVNGVVKVKELSGDGKIDRTDYLLFAINCDSITVKAEAKVDVNGIRDGSGDKASQEFVINVVKIAGAEVSLNGGTNALAENLTLMHEGAGIKYSINLLANAVTYNFPEMKGIIVLDETVELSSKNIHKCGRECCTHICDPDQECIHRDGHLYENHIGCLACSHECEEENYDCYKVPHTEDCYRGKCPHISGGDHDITSVVDGNVNKEGCASACTHVCNENDGCFQNCAHYESGDHYKPQSEGGCLTCPHLASTHDLTTCCPHGANYESDKSVGTESVAMGSGTLTLKVCSMCPNKDVEGHWCYKVVTKSFYGNYNSSGVKKFNVGEIGIVNSACGQSCQAGKATNTTSATHTHSDACCPHRSGNHDATACYTCEHQATHTQDSVCRSCNHTHNDAEKCFVNCSSNHTHTDACVNREVCDFVQGGDYSKGHDGTYCAHSCNANDFACWTEDTCNHEEHTADCLKCDHVCITEGDNKCTYECKYNGGDTPANVPTLSGATITTAGQSQISLTVQVGNLTLDDINVDIADIDNFAFIRNPKLPASDDLVIYVGNNSTLQVGDFFQLKSGKDFPEGAELRIYGNVGGDDNFMNPDRGEMFLTINEALGVYCAVDKNVLAISSALTETFDFTGIRDDEVYLAIFQNGVRISKDVKVKVVNGTNIRNFTDLRNVLDANKAVTDNLVFLNNIYMDGSVSNFFINTYTAKDDEGKDVTLPYVLYGNRYTLNIEKGVDSGMYGIIGLAGRIQDVKIVGRVYKELSLTAMETYGTNAVWAVEGASIENCYIANTRAPLIVGTEGNTTGVITIKDSILFGGRYANIDLRGGKLLVEGTVTTVQIPLEYDNTTVIGLGVAAWFTDSKKAIEMATDANGNSIGTLKQYNFLNESYADELPDIKHSGVPIMSMKDPFNALFTDTYKDYWFTHNNTTYVHSGIIAVDQYMVNMTVEGINTRDLGLGIMGNEADDPITIKLVAPTGINLAGKKFTLVYQAGVTGLPDYKEADGSSDGSVEVTYEELVNGYTLYCASTNPFVKSLYSIYDFYLIDCDEMLTISVKGINKGTDGSVNAYKHTKYQYNLEAGFTAAGKLGFDLHGNGLHYDKMPFDVYTYDNAKQSNKDILEEYIAMDNYYHYEEFDFNANGTFDYYKLPEQSGS